MQSAVAALQWREFEGPPRPVLVALRPFVIFGAPNAYPPLRDCEHRMFSKALQPRRF